MFIQGKMYDAVRWTAQVVLPAVATFYFTVAQIWGLPNAEQVVGTLVALATLLGVFVGLSKVSYDRSGAKYDGEIVVTKLPDGNKRADLVLKNYENPADIVNQKEVLFKVNPKTLIEEDPDQ